MDFNTNTNINMNMNFNLDINKKCKYICEFILLLINELDEDNFIFNNKEAYNNIQNEIQHEYIENRSKNYFKEETDYISYLMQKAFGKKTTDGDDIEDILSLEEKEYNNESNYTEQESFIKDKIKKYLTDKFGYSPTEDQIETYKSDYMDSMLTDLELDEEADNWDSTAMGKDVLDQGAGYGEFNEYDFETGEGFDYSDQMAEY